MSQLLSTPLANNIAVLIANTFADGFIDFYDTDPSVVGATLLASCKLPIAPFTASSGVLTLAGQWFGTTSHAGTTAFARLRDKTTTNYLVLTVGGSASGKQVIVSNPVLALNDVVSVTAFTYTVPLT